MFIFLINKITMSDNLDLDNNLNNQTNDRTKRKRDITDKNTFSMFHLLFLNKSSEHWSKIFKKDFIHVIDSVVKSMMNKESTVEFPVVYPDTKKRLESILNMLNLKYEIKNKKRMKSVMCDYWEPEDIREEEENVNNFVVFLTALVNKTGE